jgi:hypothetical protein
LNDSFIISSVVVAWVTLPGKFIVVFPFLWVTIRGVLVILSLIPDNGEGKNIRVRGLVAALRRGRAMLTRLRGVSSGI